MPEVVIHPAAGLDTGADMAVLRLLDGKQMLGLAFGILRAQFVIGEIHHFEEDKVDHQYQDEQSEK